MRRCLDTVRSVFIVLMLSALMLVGLSACSGDDGQEISLSPFSGLWTLRQINDVTVTDPAKIDRYMFSSSPVESSGTPGKGIYYYHSAADPDSWITSDFEWEILSSKLIRISGPAGGGTFEWMVAVRSGYTELRLYDSASDIERVYFR